MDRVPGARGAEWLRCADTSSSAARRCGAHACSRELKACTSRGPAQFHVVVPAEKRHGHSSSSESEARAVSQQRLDAALAEFSAAELAVDGEVGKANLLDAVHDALDHADYDEIILSTLPPGLSALDPPGSRPSPQAPVHAPDAPRRRAVRRPRVPSALAASVVELEALLRRPEAQHAGDPVDDEPALGPAAATIRSVIGWSPMRSFECTLATTTSSSASRSSSWSRRPSSRMSTSMPVRMRNGASSSLSAGHLELLETLGVESVGDRELGVCTFATGRLQTSQQLQISILIC